MQEIQSYKVTWRPTENVGMIHLCLADGAASVPIDSAMEMMMLVDLLRNESPVYYDARHEVVLTGFEPVGEGSNDADAQKVAAAS